MGQAGVKAQARAGPGWDLGPNGWNHMFYWEFSNRNGLKSAAVCTLRAPLPMPCQAGGARLLAFSSSL
jgi:hypothetical protein